MFTKLKKFKNVLVLNLLSISISLEKEGIRKGYGQAVKPATKHVRDKSEPLLFIE